jgi:tetratricopeptide (TPR) repeat protein
LPLSARLANALVSYARYLGKMVWPSDLITPYPYPDQWPLPEVIGAGILLAVISAAAIWWLRSRPWLAVGWFWFLGTLAPVIGLVQAGMQSMADRYTYMPSIGAFIIVAWSIPKRWTVWPRPGFVFGSVTAGVLLFLLIFTEAQLQYWRNSVTLFSHTVEVTGDSIIAEYNLAEALAERGDEERAIEHYRKALAIRPNRVEALYNSQVQAHFNLGVIYRAHEKWADAEAQFRACLLADPANARARRNLELALSRQGKSK